MVFPNCPIAFGKIYHIRTIPEVTDIKKVYCIGKGMNIPALFFWGKKRVD